MNMTAFIDVAIGLTLLYLGTSLFVTIINEYLAQILNRRAVHLKRALDKLFSQKGLEGVLTDYKKLIHAQKSGTTDPRSQKDYKAWSFISDWLERVGLKWPSDEVGTYVDPNILAQILVGKLIASTPGPNPSTTQSPVSGTPTTAAPLVQSGGSSRTAPPVKVTQGAGSGSKATLSTIVDSNPILAAGPVKDVLMALAQGAGDEVARFTKGVSEWFDRSLTVLGESYKKSMQRVSFMVGFVVAISFNIDTLTVTDRLYRDKELRDQAVAVAEESVKNMNAALIEECTKLPFDQIERSEKCKPVVKVIGIGKQRSEALELPIGWTSKGSFWAELFSQRFFGWVLTALAVSLEAPFWFDLLSNVINVRHGISRPTVSGEESKT